MLQKFGFGINSKKTKILEMWSNIDIKIKISNTIATGSLLKIKLYRWIRLSDKKECSNKYMYNYGSILHLDN